MRAAFPKGAAGPTCKAARERTMADGRVLTGMKRGLRLRCPECGDGRLYRAYLKVQCPCVACGHDNLQYPADDAPPYFTIFLVGHLVIAPMLFFNFVWTWPLWLVLCTTLPMLLILSLIVLPLVKGAAIGAMWAMRFTRKPGQSSPAGE